MTLTQLQPTRGHRGGGGMNAHQKRRSVPHLSLTRQEAAQALGMGLSSFKTYVQPHVKIVRRGSLRLIPVAELERWLDENGEAVLDDDA